MARMTPMYPDVEVELLGQDGNAFNIIGLCKQAFRRSDHWDIQQWKHIQAEMMSGDYDNLLQTAMCYFEII